MLAKHANGATEQEEPSCFVHLTSYLQEVLVMVEQECGVHLSRAKGRAGSNVHCFRQLLTVTAITQPVARSPQLTAAKSFESPKLQRCFRNFPGWLAKFCWKQWNSLGYVRELHGYVATDLFTVSVRKIQVQSITCIPIRVRGEDWMIVRVLLAPLIFE
jgi:hypothetical protein